MRSLAHSVRLPASLCSEPSGWLWITYLIVSLESYATSLPSRWAGSFTKRRSMSRTISQFYLIYNLKLNSSALGLNLRSPGREMAQKAEPPLIQPPIIMAHS